MTSYNVTSLQIDPCFDTYDTESASSYESTVEYGDIEEIESNFIQNDGIDNEMNVAQNVEIDRSLSPAENHDDELFNEIILYEADGDDDYVSDEEVNETTISRPLITLDREQVTNHRDKSKKMINHSYSDNTEDNGVNDDEIILSSIDEHDGPEITIDDSMDDGENTINEMITEQNEFMSWQFQPYVMLKRLTNDEIIKATSILNSSQSDTNDTTITTIQFDDDSSIIHEYSPRTAKALHSKVIKLGLKNATLTHIFNIIFFFAFIFIFCYAR